MPWIQRIVNTFRREPISSEIDEELQFHLDARVADNLRAGLSPDEARRDAERRLGGVLRTRERTRDANLLIWLETIVQDTRYALRSVRRNPIVSAVIVVSVALAVGAGAAVFGIVDAVLLRSLPYADANRVAMLWTANTLNGAMEQNTSVLNMEDWKAHARMFDDMAAYREEDGPVFEPGQAVDTHWSGYAWVSDRFFPLLGRLPIAGRALAPDDFAQARHVAVIAHALSLARFGGANTVGKRLNVSGFDVEVVGVMPADYWFPTKDVQIWMPATLNPRWQRSRGDRSTRFGAVIGRLAPGADLDRARAEMRVIAADLRRQYPAANENLDVNVVPLQVQVLGTTVPFMLAVLLAAVACVLLIACANVANLLLARGVVRRREIAVRAALGAGRGRIARQLLTESILLSCAGGALGLAVAAVTMRTLVALAPATIPRLDDARVNVAVLSFATVVSVAAGVLFGLAPALRSARERGDLMHTRNAASDSSASLRRTLVVAQFALALVLLTAAGLLGRSLLAVRAVDSGFDGHGVVTAHLRFHTSLPRERRAALYGEALERIRAIPGVRAVGGIATMFWAGGGSRFGLRAVDDHSDERRDRWEALTWTTVSGDYFQAVGVPLLRGRFFNDTDRRHAPPVVLVNETMARRYWPGSDPVGHRIKGFDPRGVNDDWVTVIGVVRDVRAQGLERVPMAQIFESQSQSLDETEDVAIRAAGSAGVDAIRRTVRALDPTAVLDDVSTLDNRLLEQSASRRFQVLILAAFATLAVVLAGAGIFAAMHYSVARRTQEIGIRLALGAGQRSVVAMVFGEALGLTAIGVAFGLAGALAVTQLLAHLLFGVTPHDPWTFAAVSAGLAAVAVAAAVVPATRAARVDPLAALRSE